jgi:hypothetical protein
MISNFSDAEYLGLFPGDNFLDVPDDTENSRPRHRLPVIAAWREFVDAGCLVSYGPSRASRHAWTWLRYTL